MSLLTSSRRRGRRHQTDSPEVVAEVLVGDVGIRHVAVAAITPISTPAVTHDEALLVVVETNDGDRVTADVLLVLLRHRHHAGLSDLRRFERCEHVETENNREPFLQASLEMLQVLIHTHVLDRAVFQGFGEAIVGRLLGELGDVVRPHVFRADALLTDGLDPSPDFRASILIDRSIQEPFVPIDEQPRRHEGVLDALFQLVEVITEADGVRGAAAERALVVDRGAEGTQVEHRVSGFAARGIAQIAMVLPVSLPAAVQAVLLRCFVLPRAPVIRSRGDLLGLRIDRRVALRFGDFLSFHD